MRPRRLILLHCADEKTKSILRFVLHVTMHVLVVGEEVDLQDQNFGCAVVVRDEARVAELQPLVPVLSLRAKGDPLLTMAHQVRSVHDIAGIREAIHNVCARKRGPKPTAA